MKSHARVVVIGGGVVGVGTLYALTKKGWTDVVLLERNELTSGSTWHAAGLLPLFNMSYSVGKVHQYSLDLYSKLEEETGQHVGLRQVSNIRLAQTKDRWDEFMYYAGIAETIGVEVNLLTPAQVKEIWPLCNTDGLIGAIQHPNDGYVQPADLTQAMAKGARDKGAQIYRQTRVIAIEQKANDEWLVKTDKGDIACEHLVTATGNFVRQTGEMLGLDIPVIPVEHQYIVTEAHPEIQQRHKDGLPEMGVLRDADSAWYMREEAGGLILGPYEPGAPVCYVDGPDEDAEYELFQEDLERIAPHIESAFHRVPAFGEVGIKKVYNGAICYTPDGSPIIGPAWGKRNLWLNEGHSFGVTAAGGAGWQLAEWIVEGESSIDMLGVDPRRFGPYASRGYLKVKNEEAYRNVFTPHYPDEERWDARPLKQSPCYDRMKALGAVFGSVYGWERPNWFAPSADYGWNPEEIERPDVITRENHAQVQPGEKVKELWSFRRSNYFEHVGNEVKNVTENCGVLDMTAFAKYEVSGPKAAEWLDSILANRVPKGIGRVGLCHLLTKNGGVRSEFTVYKRAENDFYLVGPGAWERHDWDYLTKLKPESGVTLNKITTQMGVLVLAGPKSRDVLQKLTDTDLSNDNFKWLTGKFINVGIAQAHALRVNFVGELGWELHHPIEMQNIIFDMLMEAGREHGIKPFGIRAMGTMAVEKSYRLIGRELSVEYSAYESGLDRFVHPNKGDFIGRDELVKRHAAGDNWTFVTMEVHGIKDCDARGSEAIYAADGKTLVGRVTTGSYGWRVGKSLALAMVKPDQAAEGSKLKVKILGELFDATIIGESPFDPDNERLRA